MHKTIISFTIFLLCFSNSSIFGQKSITIKNFKYSPGDWTILEAKFELDGVKYKMNFTDGNENHILTDKGVRGDGLNIASLNKYKQYANAYLRDTITITLFKKSFYITNLEKGIKQKKVKLISMPFTENANIVIRDHLPHINLKDLLTDQIKPIEEFLPDTSYKYFVVNIWMSGCAPCEEQIQYLTKFKEMGIGVINISTDFTLHSDKKLAFSKNMCGKTAYLEDPELRRSFNVTSFPTTVLYDRNFEMKGRASGIVSMLNGLTRNPLK